MVGHYFPRKSKTDQSRNEVGVKRARDKILSRDELIKLSVQEDGVSVYAQFLKQSTLNFRNSYTKVLQLEFSVSLHSKY